ncbi:MAG TPA: CRISPR-associated ring nuclease [Ktedonobacteraceae bacterium]|jgi:CRISPR-associated protein Csx14|nr:CRISPR-associated ring nuclease [Ktedonobacteraceae bacterium]
MPEYIHTLLATLGGQPQIVTFTLDLLLQRGFPISEVIVVHPEASDARLRHSVACLNAEFVGDYYSYYLVHGQPLRCRLRSYVLELDEAPLQDIVDDLSAKGTLDTVHRLVRDLKLQHRRIHLSLTGGRRLMSLMAISAAHLNFDHFDHIWHIYTPSALRPLVNEGKVMHIPTEAGVSLIEAPFVPWGAYFPGLSQTVDTAQDMRHYQTARMDAEERARCTRVIEQATQREQEVLQAFALGLTQQEVAKELHISIKTVDAHKANLLDYCREAWNIDPDERLGYHFLYKKFAPYFDSTQYTSRARQTHQRNL